MKLSAPLYHLKRKAKLLSRAENIPLHEALDRVARQEGFGALELARGQSDRQPRPLKNCLRGWLRRPGAGRARPGQGQNPDEPRTRRAGHEVRQSRRVLHAGVHRKGYAGSFPAPSAWTQEDFAGLFEFGQLRRDECGLHRQAAGRRRASRHPGGLWTYLQLLDQKRENRR